MEWWQKESVQNAFKKLSDLTRQACDGCDHEGKWHRCCGTIFCEQVKKDLDATGIEIERPGPVGLPYMGPNGCVVPPHLRPVCTGYVCPEHFENWGFRKEYDKCINKINKGCGGDFMPGAKKSHHLSTNVDALMKIKKLIP